MQDCVAHDIVYHNACFSNFRSDCQIPKMFRDEELSDPKDVSGRRAVRSQRCFGAKSRQEKKSCSGRHNNTRLSAFDNVIQYLDTLDSEQVTVRDLFDIMAEHLKD